MVIDYLTMIFVCTKKIHAGAPFNLLLAAPKILQRLVNLVIRNSFRFINFDQISWSEGAGYEMLVTCNN